MSDSGKWSEDKLKAFAELRADVRANEIDASRQKAARSSASRMVSPVVSGDSVMPLLAGEVSPSVVNNVKRFDNALAEAVSAAKIAGVPQGFVVALLHAHAARETSQLLG